MDVRNDLSEELEFAARAICESAGRQPASDPEASAVQAGRSANGDHAAGSEEFIPVPGRSPLPPRRKRRRKPSRRVRGPQPEKPALTIEQILQWADEHHQRTGAWPNRKSGRIAAAPREKWSAVDSALQAGCRGLTAGTTLARLLQKYRGRFSRRDQPHLTEAKILAWADEHQQRTGAWPTADSGPVGEAPHQTWCGVNVALNKGGRGLKGRSSLARLLADHRGAPHRADRLQLTEAQILQWADAHRLRTGRWPTERAGSVSEAPEEHWAALSQALKCGLRGLSGGISLARLLARDRGVRNRTSLPRLTEAQILDWADAYRARTGRWPQSNSGAIPESPDDTWSAVDTALAKGSRGLGGDAGNSLAELLHRKRGRRHQGMLPPFSEAQILEWADGHHARYGAWPRKDSGAIADAEGDETWMRVERALVVGVRGLPGGSSLARLLQEARGVRNRKGLPPYSQAQILKWAKNHLERTGEWPSHASGEILDAPGETWGAVNTVLGSGGRGMAGGSSLARLLAERCGVRNPRDLPPLSEPEILGWASAHHLRTGAWPTSKSGEIMEAPGETWGAVNLALSQGRRGLAGGRTLSQLLDACCRERNPRRPPPLSEEQILEWAAAHRARTGDWPSTNSGEVSDAPGETWGAIAQALRKGNRGLTRGGSLPRLLRANSRKKSATHEHLPRAR